MKGYFEKENECFRIYSRAGRCFHLWTPDNFEIIFLKDEDFMIGMSVIGIAAKMFPDVILITFELMTNHLHLLVSCTQEERMFAFFRFIKQMFVKCFRAKGRTIDWRCFEAKTRELKTLNDTRNVIVYDNRNGFVISPDCTPFTYKWGANRYYFNPDAKELAMTKALKMSVLSIRKISHSHVTDKIKDLLQFEGYALPLSFCDISLGENLFRDSSHYFNRLSKSIESNKEIAKELGESVYYNDEELFAAIMQMARNKYHLTNIFLANTKTKMDLARVMLFEYNASPKQITRMLKLSPELLASMGIVR